MTENEMTENEKLRALLAEARAWVVAVQDDSLRERIDEALAEPVEPTESEHDKAVAAAWWARCDEVERERDGARAELAREKATWAELQRAGNTAYANERARADALMRERDEAQKRAEERNDEANKLQRYLNMAAQERDEARAARNHFKTMLRERADALLAAQEEIERLKLRFNAQWQECHDGSESACCKVHE